MIEEFGILLDDLDGEISAGKSTRIIARLHSMRHELNIFRRSMVRQREAIGTLVRGDEVEFFQDETCLYLRDCQDHTQQLIDAVDAIRDMTADLREFHYSLAAERSNETAQFLTVIATIFIPLSFITGLYGMNFNPAVSPWNMPELDWFYGYPFALGMMATVVGAMLLYFWRKGWLGRRS